MWEVLSSARWQSQIMPCGEVFNADPNIDSVYSLSSELTYFLLTVESSLIQTLVATDLVN